MMSRSQPEKKTRIFLRFKPGFTNSEDGFTKSEDGFTLVELIIYVGILSTILLVASQFLVEIEDFRLEYQGRNVVAQEGRFILERMTYDIHRASEVTQPLGFGEVSDSLTLLINGLSYAYQISGTTLQLLEGVNTYDLTSNEVQIQNLNFQRIGNSGGKATIKVFFRLEAEKQPRSGSRVKDFQTTISLR